MLFKCNPKEFLRRFLTDKTWIHWYTPETKEQSKQWTSSGEHAPKKAKTVLSAGKVMATIFWDSQGLNYIDYLEKAPKRSQGSTMPNNWSDSMPNCRKNDPIWRRKKYSSTTTHQLTPPPSPRPNWSNCTMNCCPIHRIL